MPPSAVQPMRVVFQVSDCPTGPENWVKLAVCVLTTLPATHANPPVPYISHSFKAYPIRPLAVPNKSTFASCSAVPNTVVLDTVPLMLMLAEDKSASIPSTIRGHAE